MPRGSWSCLASLAPGRLEPRGPEVQESQNLRRAGRCGTGPPTQGMPRRRCAATRRCCRGGLGPLVRPREECAG
eukprot:10481714-Alexandrium_andersonii.AAC.1